ncbi:MAG: hypothetical protein RL750_126 [Bacteroidota bacterium]|jgi:hypothetical protein
MKFWLSIVAIALIGFLCGLYMPWWSIALPAFVIGLLIPQKGSWNFVSGFLGIFLLWLGLTVWIDAENGGLLAARMAQILPVGGKVIYLHLLTASVGGLLGGLASLSGKHIRSLLPKQAV